MARAKSPPTPEPEPEEEDEGIQAAEALASDAEEADDAEEVQEEEAVEEGEEEEEDEEEEPKKTGRRITLNDEIIKAFATNLSMGLTWGDACTLVPCDPTTAFKWRREGEAIRAKLGDKKLGENASEKRRLYYEFSLAVDRAIPRRKRKLLGIIHDAGIGSWQASAWLLERLHSDEFAIRNRVEHGGPNGGPIATKNETTISMPDDVLAAIQKIYGALPETHDPDTGAPGGESPADAASPHEG